MKELTSGTFKRFKKTTAEIYSLNITEEQYKKLKKVIDYFGENKEKYSFNVIGLACVCIKKKITVKNTFYCAEFVKHVLKSSGIIVNGLPKIIKPQDFKNIEGLNLEYQGLLKKYNNKSNLQQIFPDEGVNCA